MPRTILTAILMFSTQLATAQVTSNPQYWRDDLHTLTASLPLLHPNLYFQVSPDEFQSAAAALDQQIPGLTDSQIIVKMAELVAKVGDAHTNLGLTQSAVGFRTFPLRVQWFDDGLFVIAALPGAEQAIGKRVTRIGGADILAAYSDVVPLISAENDVWRLRVSEDYLVVPEVLEAAGVISSADSAEFEFNDSTGTSFTLELQAYPVAAARNWIYVPDLTSAAVPLYRKLNNQNYWFQYLSDSRTLYFKYNACSNAAKLPFTTFTTEFLKTVDAFPVDQFVFDLRNNGGGDSSLIQPLLSALEQRYISGQLASAQLFVLIGRDTFSSALLNALQLSEAPLTTLVGEPTGGKPNHYGNVSTLTLPRSGIRISYSTTFFASSVTTSSLEPDIHVALPSSAFFQNRDPFMEAVLGTESAKTNVAPFVLYSGGGTRAQTSGVDENLHTGYATVESSPGSPFGFGVLQYRKDGILVSEATVPSTHPVTSAITYAEVDGRVNTGIAIANHTETAAAVAFEVSNESGQVVTSGILPVAAGAQTAQFLSEEPFNVSSLTGGALRLTSSVPVSMLALRGYTNERDEFLLSTLAVTEPGAGTSPIYCAQFADGGGWTTQINLVNPSNQMISGTVEFVPGDRISYALPPNSARRFRTSGLGEIRTGFVRITPDAGSIVASATALFSYHREGITVTEASVHGTPATASQTLLASGSGGFEVGAAGAVMSGIAVANPGAESRTALVSLVSLAGGILGSTMIDVPPNGHLTLFLNELFAGNVSMPFEGTLQITSSAPLAVTGLRGQYNQRADFLISATPVFDQAPGSVFTHIVDGGGYSTRFVFAGGSAPGGVIRFFGREGQPLSLTLQ
jgi:Peptidase family S41